ncbi:UDP-2,3-diacylglucosamine diphosphatase [Rosistilla oblonga]|uniref:UDP-2,3-diacylglucosamine diphosphatase n=1 Tax=Rosistilla oblonga TaxID=2527990 RepID=UPI003A9841B1
MIDNKAKPIADATKSMDWELSDARTLFISDIHLGSRFCQVGPLLDLLDRCLPQHIYIVGDLFDDRRLSRRFRWTADYTRLIARLFDFGVSGTSIHYTPGNHDTFLRSFAEDYRLVEIRDSFIHQCADGRRLAVLHGDQFDVVEKKMRWLSELGSTAYEILLATDRSLNWMLRLLGGRPVRLSRSLKVGVKKIVQRKSGFHDKVYQYAGQMNCEGVVCGHIHNPEMQSLDGVLYCNTGDWIEHCTAMVEWPDGKLQIIRADELSGQRRRRPIFHRLKRRLGESIRSGTATTVGEPKPAESSPNNR